MLLFPHKVYGLALQLACKQPECSASPTCLSHGSISAQLFAATFQRRWLLQIQCVCLLKAPQVHFMDPIIFF